MIDDNQESKTEQQLSKKTKTTAHKTKKRGIISAIESLTGTTPRFHVILSNIRGKGSFDKR